MKTLLKTLIGSVFCLLITTSVSAEEFNLHVADIDSCKNFGASADTLGNSFIKVRYLDVTYDDATNLLTFETEVDNSRGLLADAFHFVLTPGDLAQGEAAAAHVYFDANDCLLYTSPSPRDKRQSRMPSSA